MNPYTISILDQRLKGRKVDMSTINSRDMVDNIIKHNGFYNGDDTIAPDNPRCVKIVQYDNAWGGIGYGIVFETYPDKTMYDRVTLYIKNPKTIWEYKIDA